MLAATWRYLVRIDKLPIVLGGLAGAVLGIWLTPRRARVPLAVLALLLFVYVAEGAAGASVIDRYMMGAAALLLPFCALAIGGWSLLRPGSLLRRVWMAAGAALLVYGAVAAVSVTSLSNARTTLAYHDDFHEGLAAALHSPAVRAELARCPLLSLPDNKLIPDARWILGAGNQREIVARSEARADSEAGDPHAHATGSRARASRYTRSAPPSSRRRSSTSATTRSTRSRCPASGGSTRAATTRSMATADRRRLVWAALALVLLLALGLRLWGIRQGLPYAYNSDEDAHFVPRAIGMLTLGWNPHYFANPPAYTDLLRLVFAAWFGGRAGVSHTFAVNPTAVFTLARVCAALLGTLAVWLLYIAGARLFDRGVALLAAALEAVAFLPVFYSHLALNDVPTLAPLTLSLLGTAGVLRKGRARDYADRGGRPRPRLRDEVHRRDRAAAAARRRRGAVSARRRHGARRVPMGLPWRARVRGDQSRRRVRERHVPCRPGGRWWLASRSPAPPRWWPSWSPTPTRCSTSTPSSRVSPTSPRSPAKPRASSARRARAGSSTTCGRSPGVSAGCPRSPRSPVR